MTTDDVGPAPMPLRREGHCDTVIVSSRDELAVLPLCREGRCDAVIEFKRAAAVVYGKGHCDAVILSSCVGPAVVPWHEEGRGGDKQPCIKHAAVGEAASTDTFAPRRQWCAPSQLVQARARVLMG